MNHVKITTIIPVYETDNYLEACLQSVVKALAGQNGVEVLLIDDGSTDTSGEICRKYAAQYPWFHYIYKENEGVSKARNLGIHMARGSYVHFLDSDDFIHPAFYHCAVEAIDGALFDACFFEYEDLPQKETKFSAIRSNRRELFHSPLSSGNDVLRRLVNTKIRLSSSCTALYEKDFLLQHGIEFDDGLSSSEDLDFVNTVLIHAGRVAYSPQTSIIYRRYRHGSATNSYDNHKILCDLRIRKKWYDAALKLELRPYSFYANEFVDFLYCWQINAPGSEEVLRYFRSNRHLLKAAVSKKGKLLRLLTSLFGLKAGLGMCIKIYRRGVMKGWRL